MPDSHLAGKHPDIQWDSSFSEIPLGPFGSEGVATLNAKGHSTTGSDVQSGWLVSQEGNLNFVMDAVNLGYRFVLPRDAVAGVPPSYADAVIENTLSLLATVTTTDDVLRSWQR